MPTVPYDTHNPSSSKPLATATAVPSSDDDKGGGAAAATRNPDVARAVQVARHLGLSPVGWVVARPGGVAQGGACVGMCVGREREGRYSCLFGVCVCGSRFGWI